MKHQFLIGVGSNINKHYNIGMGVQALSAHFDDLKLSTTYQSESVGFRGNLFFNLVVLAYSEQPIHTVCATLKQIEDSQGRIRDDHMQNRTLDLDLLTFDDLVCCSPIVLPRKEIEYNAFVLKPLAELVPHQLHPSTQLTYREMWHAFERTHPNNHQRLWPTDLNWSDKLA